MCSCELTAALSDLIGRKIINIYGTCKTIKDDNDEELLLLAQKAKFGKCDRFRHLTTLRQM